MRILGLDIGDKRIGVAVSDPLGMTAQGVGTITRSNLKKDLEELAKILKEWQCEKIVVGLPKNMNGTLGPQSEKVKEFMAQFLARHPVEVIYWDERLTTMAAERTLIEGNVSRQKRKQVVDKLAASIILQGYLDTCR